MENVMVLLSCNEWKEYSSSRIIGVFNDESLLKKEIYKMFLSDELEWCGESIRTLKQDCITEVQSSYKYLEEEIDIDEEIRLAFEENKEDILQSIENTPISELDDKSTYIMIEILKINEAY